MWFVTAALAGTVLLSVEDPGQPPPVEIVGGRVRQCFASSRVCLVEGARAADLRGLPGVRRAEEDAPMVQASGVVWGPTAQCPNPYELTAIGVDPAWEQVCGVDAPVVAIEDSGFRTTHDELVGQVAGGWDYGNDDPTPEVEPDAGVPGHGTFIAGVIAALEGDVGRTGIAPEAELFLQKIADQDGALLFSYAIAAMDDLVAAHPEVGVLNYSIASSTAPAAFADAVTALGDADIVLVAAAANCPAANCADANNDQFPIWPASYPGAHVLAVASLRSGGSLDPFSHFGVQSVDVAAPGAEICSLDIDADDAYLISSGTSFAAPVVAGVAALVRERWPRLTAGEVVDTLVRSCVADAALANKVRCGGPISASRALAVPVVTWDVETDLVVAPMGTARLTGDSRGAGGEVFVVVTHPPEVAVDLVGAVPFTEGDALPLPGGDEDADGAGSWFVAPVPADGPAALDLPFVAVGDGGGDVDVRLIPFAADLLGAEQTVSFAVSAEAPASTTPTDPRTTETADTGAAAAREGCGCATGAAGPSVFGAVGLALARRRRLISR